MCGGQYISKVPSMIMVVGKVIPCDSAVSCFSFPVCRCCPTPILSFQLFTLDLILVTRVHLLHTRSHIHMAISSLHVHTESDAIHLYTGENMIPNSSYVLHGHVELNIRRPVRIRQISVQFKGTVHNVISNELIQHHQDISANSDFWPITIVSKQSTAIFERMSRFAVSTALGYTISNQKIVRQRVDLLPADATTTRIEPGVSRWPFALEIDHPEKLLPSLLLPRHTIRYDLIVHVQLASLRDKITQRKLRITKPIHVLCHAYPSLHILDFQPRVRYRGCREGHMRYEVSMVKFVPLNQKLRLVCHFFPLCAEARISTIAMLIEQHELFP